MFEWDDAKSQDNLEKRGFDFEYAARIFKTGDLLEYEGRHRDYGERRMIAIGEVEGEILLVVYTWREYSRRIISARLASRRERDAHRQTFSKSNR
ncbi:MAG TPA: BrnT family toxin [Candidatus Binataceae bacterium]|nr:BrnT family toxin [Candidatus Binataceae bacterium]